MHGPLNITADRLASEAAGFHRELGVGLQTLREVEQFDYGATEKQEVWRDGKTELYRFVGHGRPTAKPTFQNSPQATLHSNAAHLPPANGSSGADTFFSGLEPGRRRFLRAAGCRASRADHFHHGILPDAGVGWR